MKMRQKLGLLLSLCLSLRMIIVGLIRSLTLPRAGVEIFLLQLKASIAVLMTSMSAFRSQFASEGS